MTKLLAIIRHEYLKRVRSLGFILSTLSRFIGLATILILLRLAARVYHTAMLMYGKKVSVSEVMRWVRAGS